MVWIMTITFLVVVIPALLLGLCTLVDWLGLVPVVVGVFGLIAVYLLVTGAGASMGGLAMVTGGLLVRAVLTIIRDTQVQGQESTGELQ